jgi:hypothetical protein
MNTRQQSHRFRPKACQKCGGDGFFDHRDEREWRCLQCGRSLDPHPAVPTEDLTSARLPIGEPRTTHQ